MPTILTRAPAYSAWNPAELAGPYEALTLREWEVAVAACSLEAQPRLLLLEALLEPATPTCERRWRWPLPRLIIPFDPQLLRLASTETLRNHLIEDAATLWQLLDLPPAVIPGMLRGLLLVGLGARLRHTLAALEGRPGVLPPQQELAQALTTLGAQLEPVPTPPAPLRPPLAAHREPPVASGGKQPPRRRKRWWRRAA